MDEEEEDDDDDDDETTPPGGNELLLLLLLWWRRWRRMASSGGKAAQGLSVESASKRSTSVQFPSSVLGGPMEAELRMEPSHIQSPCAADFTAAVTRAGREEAAGGH